LPRHQLTIRLSYARLQTHSDKAQKMHL
jgi:hypothetical protein